MDAAEKNTSSARSFEASLHTLGSPGSAGGSAHAAEARPRTPAGAWDTQQRHRDASRHAELSSGGGSGVMHALPGSLPRASPSEPQAVAPPEVAGGAFAAGLHSRAPGGGDNKGFGSLIGGREVDTPAKERDCAGGKGCTPFPGFCGGMDGQEQAGVTISANGVPRNRTAAAPGEGAAAHGGMRRRRGPNPFSPAG